MSDLMYASEDMVEVIPSLPPERKQSKRFRRS